ncbi:SET domain containing protein [uncultured Caudovirales phage]|uniref:SET domain containing protein n=1 Tax=uncultured Caudovirales phage TaxID=2100421 RepID=A0A6J5L6D0_9CAUD|nr:SET domain containing protein [uncultured Caudovirales phage]
MFRKKTSPYGGDCLVADQKIPRGSFVFPADEWTDDERRGWHTLTIPEVMALTENERSAFLTYSYDVDFERTVGTLDSELAAHGSNFVNHCCSPNLGFDSNGNVVAIKDIIQGEELTMDYGTFVVNFDQDFICDCGADNCRGPILKDDWRFLSRYGKLKFPRFIQEKIDQNHK